MFDSQTNISRPWGTREAALLRVAEGLVTIAGAHTRSEVVRSCCYPSGLARQSSTGVGYRRDKTEPDTLETVRQFVR